MALTVAEHLIVLFLRNGCVREPNRKRRAAENRTYKKGYEVRLFAADKEELSHIRQLLRKAGFDKFGKAYEKGTGFIQPIYGAKAVKWFREKAEEAASTASS